MREVNRGNLRLNGKVAALTGGSGGIGRATALLLAREGASVFAGSIDAREHSSLIAEAAHLPGTIKTVEMDVAREADARRLIRTAVEECGGLDILVNNAGIVSGAQAPEESEEQFLRILEVNLKGCFLCSKYAVTAMRERGGGSIVNVSSINGIRGNQKLVSYCASKGGVVAMTQAMAIDHATENIRVNCVCPGAVERTGMVDRPLASADDPEAFLQHLIDKHPMGRLARPEEVAQAILFLASDEASFITGVTLPVDGGRSVR